MDTMITRIETAKLRARHLAGVLGSLSHAHVQVNRYPDSDAAKQYLADQEATYAKAVDDLDAALKKL